MVQMDVLVFDVYNMADTGGVSKTLNAIKCDSDHVPVVCYDAHNLIDTGGVSMSMTAGRNDTHNIPVVCYEGEQELKVLAFKERAGCEGGVKVF